jgi:hypothetical protein
MGKMERKQLLGRPRCIWEDNIKTNLTTGWNSTDWILLPQEIDECWVLVNNAMILQTP